MSLPRLPGIALAAALLAAPEPAAARCGEPSGPGHRAAALTSPGASPGAAAPVVRAAPAPEHDDGPVTAGAQSREATAARALFDAGVWAEAAPALARVASGETGDDDGNRQIARFHLGVALYRLRLHDASLRVFAVIADAPTHYGFDQGLVWLAALDAELPEPAGVVDHLSKYLIQGKEPARADLRARVHHLLGKHAYQRRSYELATRELEQVAPESSFYPRSQFLLGMSYVVLRKVVPAVKAFQRVVSAVGESTRGEDAAHLRNLAWISMARAYYSTAIRPDEACAPTIDANKLSAAVKYWNKIEIDSELWPDARFESSWAYFMAGDYAHALGNLHNLDSGYVAPLLYPEADVVRGIVSFTLCQYDDVITHVARMRQRYAPLRRELAALIGRLDGAGSDEAILAFHDAARAGRAPVPAILGPIVSATLPDRPVQRHLDYLRFVAAEEARLRALPVAFRASPLGEEVETSLSLARRAAVHGAAARIRELYQRRLDELDAQLRETTKLLVDVQTARSAREREAPGPPALATTAVPSPDVEHVIWPFDGEFWRDEIGSYRQVVVSQCGR